MSSGNTLADTPSRIHPDITPGLGVLGASLADTQKELESGLRDFTLFTRSLHRAPFSPSAFPPARTAEGPCLRLLCPCGSQPKGALLVFKGSYEVAQ